MYIAKMTTRYPDFHGEGYYNFILETTKDALLSKVEDMSHDFRLSGTVKTRHKNIDTLVAKYPTKQDLNEKFFERG